MAAAIDDSTNVFLSLDAESSVSGWPLKTYTPMMILRCKENRTQAYIVTGMARQGRIRERRNDGHAAPER